jgi:hypothetical protein
MTNNCIDPIARLWQGARAWFAELRSAYGATAQIAALASAACAALTRELRALESLVLKLLLIEALRFHPFRRAAPSRVANIAEQSAAQAARRLRKLVSTDPEPVTASEEREQEDAPPVFALRLPYDRAPHRLRATPARAASEPRPRDLARRFEALASVLADPAAAVARLVCRLRALGPRAARIARRIALHRPRAEPRHPMLFAHACVHCCDALEESG